MVGAVGQLVELQGNVLQDKCHAAVAAGTCPLGIIEELGQVFDFCDQIGDAGASFPVTVVLGASPVLYCCGVLRPFPEVHISSKLALFP